MLVCCLVVLICLILRFVLSWSSSLQKLAVGCLPEKILTAFHSVLDEHLNEEAALNKCNAGVHDVVKLLEDVENTLAQGKKIAERPLSILPAMYLTDANILF